MSINTLERPSLWSFASAASKIASYRSCQRRGGASAMESTAVLCGVMGKHPKNLSRLIAGKHVSIMHHSASTAFAQGELCLARSEEHTSELQSLMRISYAVFCLKKKKSNY